MKKLNYYYILFLFVFFGTPGFSQIVINEVCSSNFDGYLDNDGDTEDWIELYNAGEEPVDLDNYSLSDDTLLPIKWALPSYILEPGEYLTIFASDKDRHDYIDHWEAIAKESDTWKYLLPDSEVSDSWRKPGFDDESWDTGQGGFGYGDSDDTTLVPEGSVSIFLRKTFDVADRTTIKNMILNMDFDDGFVAYLNGVEIARENITGTAQYDTRADGDNEAIMVEGELPEKYNIPSTTVASLIQNGENVLAIQVHNVSSTSSDLSARPFLLAGVTTSNQQFSALPEWFEAPNSAAYFHANFKVSADGESIVLANAAGTVIDRVDLPPVTAGNTYGRTTDGEESWSLLTPPSPNENNENSTPFTGFWEDKVVYSVPAGFYTDAQTVSLSCQSSESEIRYTTDGSKPTPSSEMYEGPISVSSTGVVRAACFRPGYITLHYETNTYFIGDGSTLPVFSISANPEDFFSEESGIYEMGPNASGEFPHEGANFWQNWEKEIHIEYFIEDGSQALEQDIGVKIFGGWSRGQNMKSLRLTPRKEYGPNKLEYKFFKDKNISSFDQLVLRNSGNDFNYTHLRDGVNHQVLDKNNTHMDWQAYQPVLVFINGEYWGVHNLRERVAESHAEENHGVNKDEVDLLELDAVVKEGSNDHFLQMVDFIENNDMAIASNYEAAKKMLDIENLVDYMAAQVYHTNWDWPHNNIRYWRDQNGGKWRYFYYDTDFAFGHFNYSSPTTNELGRVIDGDNYHSIMFNKLLDNDEFKAYFANRYADLINTIYQPSNYKGVVDELKAVIEPEMPRHFDRWGDNAGGMTGWESNISGIKGFMDERPGPARDNIQSELSLDGQVEVTLNVSPAGAGKIKISTIIPKDFPWEGVYFDGVPVRITAYPNPGYEFADWSSSDISLSNEDKASIRLNIDQDNEFIANFIASDKIPRITISEINYNSIDTGATAGEWVELYNYGTGEADISNWELKDGNDYNSFVFPDGTKIPAGEYLVVVSDSLKFKELNPEVKNFIGTMGFSLNNSGEEIRLLNFIGEEYLSLTYSDDPPWPFIADGRGGTMELKNPENDLNDPANWYDGCLNGSPGEGYQPCPCQDIDLGKDKVLCQEGGTVNLNTGLEMHPDRTFYWFVNDNELQGLNIPSFSVSSPGEYSVIVDSAGCIKSDIIKIKEDISIDIEDEVVLCNPISHTLDAGPVQKGMTYFWEKDGTVLEGKRKPTLTVTSPGTYTITATLSGCNPVTASAQVTSAAAAIPIDGERCEEGTVDLAVEGNSTFKWYTEPEGGNAIATGKTFTTPDLDRTTTYYVEDDDFFYYTGGPVDTAFGERWSHDNYSGYKLKFNVLNPFILRSVTVFAKAPQSVTIRVLESDGETVAHSKTVEVTKAGKAVIPLGFELEVGDGYFMDAEGTTGELSMNHTNSSFPYEVPDFLEIYRTEPDWAAEQGWYFFFYNWEVTSGPGPCQRTPVTALVKCMLTAEITPDGPTSFCEGGEVTLNANTGPDYSYQWYRNGEILEEKQTPSLTVTESGEYTVEITDGISTAISEVQKVTATKYPEVTVEAAESTDICDGDEVTLNAIGEEGYSYQWKKDGSTIPGATSSSFVATAEGQYRVTASQNFCSSSSPRIEVTVKNEAAPEIQTAGPTQICQGEETILSTESNNTSLQWLRNGTPISGGTGTEINVNSTGNYSAQISSNGCVVTSEEVTVTVNPAPVAEIDAEGTSTICEGETVRVSAPNVVGYNYQWKKDGTNIEDATSYYYNATSTGDYSVEIISGGSCSSISNEVSVTVNPVPEVTVTADGPASFCEGNDVTISASSDEVETYQWYNSSAAISGETASTFTATETGDYYVKATSKGCTQNSDFVTVSVDKKPSVANAGTDQSICSDEASIAANQPATGTGAWSVVIGSASIENETAANTSITSITTSSVTLRWTITNGSCQDSFDEITITRSATSPASVSITSDNSVICEGDSVTFTANPVNGGLSPEFEWLVNGSSTSETGRSFKILNPENGTEVSAVMVSSLECATNSPAESNIVTIETKQSPSIAYAGEDQSLCRTEATLLATNPEVGVRKWSLVNGSGSIETPVSNTTGVTGLSSGMNIFQYTVSNAPCPATTDSVAITTSEEPSEADAGEDQFISSTSTVLNATSPLTGTGKWSLLSGPGTLSNPNAYNSALTDLEIGSTTVLRYTVSNGACPASADAISIVVGEKPFVSEIDGKDTVPVNGLITYTIPEYDNASYNWSVPEGAVIISGENSNSVVVQFGEEISGSVSVTVETPFGETQASKTIYEGKPLSTLVNSKSNDCYLKPNPTASESFVVIKGKFSENLNLTITDLKGNQYESITVSPAQTLKIGKDLPAGVYMVKVNGKDFSKVLKLVKTE